MSNDGSGPVVQRSISEQNPTNHNATVPSKLIVRREQFALFAGIIASAGVKITGVPVGTKFVRIVLPDSARTNEIHNRIATALMKFGLPNPSVGGATANVMIALYRGAIPLSEVTNPADFYLVYNPNEANLASAFLVTNYSADAEAINFYTANNATIEQVIDRLRSCPDARTIYDQFVANGGTVVYDNQTFSGANFFYKMNILKINVGSNTRSIDRTVGFVLFELLRYKHVEKQRTLDDKFNVSANFLPSQYADECEFDAYEYASEHLKIATKAIADGQWSDGPNGANIFSYLKQFESAAEFNEYNKITGHWNQGLNRGTNLKTEADRKRQ